MTFVSSLETPSVSARLPARRAGKRAGTLTSLLPDSSTRRGSKEEGTSAPKAGLGRIAQRKPVQNASVVLYIPPRFERGRNLCASLVPFRLRLGAGPAAINVSEVAHEESQFPPGGRVLCIYFNENKNSPAMLHRLFCIAPPFVLNCFAMVQAMASFGGKLWSAEFLEQFHSKTNHPAWF